jgi:cytoskeleton protein RodZ
VQELGAELKRIREQKGYSLDDVQQATKIRTRYLEAIEAGELSALPGMVYVRGFIKSYADFLEINGQELLDQFGLAAEKTDAQMEPVRLNQKKERTLGKTPFNPRLLPQVVAVIGILSLITATYAYMVNRDEVQGVGDDQAQTQAADTQQQAPQPAPDQKPEPAPEPPEPKTVVQETKKEPNQTTYQVSGTSSMTMVLAVADDCWMEVKADGKVMESGIVKAGESRTWKANQSISVFTGKSKVMTVKINDQPVQIEPLLRGYTYLFNLKS